jgi:hypothetical protein
MYAKKDAFLAFEKAYSKESTKVEHSLSMCKIIREFTKSQTEWIEYIAYIGSSEYNSKQFSNLLNGVVEDAKNLGIQTISDLEIKSLIDQEFMV